ncbi:MAG: 3-phosphoserine/phosphohydroxythreonine transaminase [Pirellulales bacterium]|nr:3-phosphoserine/phosphohydroxythreonine transaminase [Pirellulales bacterium]
MAQRVFNFSSGPAVLPLPVLEQAQRDLLALPGVGMSVLEISHRSKPFDEILASTESNLRKLLGIPDGHRVLFFQGGAALQFSMIPMNLLRGTERAAEYLVAGAWGKKAQQAAALEGTARAVWDGAKTSYDRLPHPGEFQVSPEAAYFHITSNETIQGVQMPADPRQAGLKLPAGVPLVCDSSSDILSRPVPIADYGLVYACAQKNAGPAGVTVVIIRDELIERSCQSLPGILSYREFAQNNSLYNTPCVFGIYVMMLVTRWLLEDVGGLTEMARQNAAKAKLLYDVLDGSGGFYRGHAQPECRSDMNVTFRLPSEELEMRFIKAAEAADLYQLKGHRSVGGIRASIYNAMPLQGVQRLADVMHDFRRQAG